MHSYGKPHKTNELFSSCKASVLQKTTKTILRNTAIEEAILQVTNTIANNICLAGFSSCEAFILRGTNVFRVCRGPPPGHESGLTTTWGKEVGFPTYSSPVIRVVGEGTGDEALVARGEAMVGLGFKEKSEAREEDNWVTSVNWGACEA